MATQNRSYANQFIGRNGHGTRIEVITGPQLEVLDKLLTTNNETRAKLDKIIRKGLQKARKESASDLGNQIHNNDRHAEKAVRSRAYSKKSGTLGGYVTIMRKKHRNGSSKTRPIPPTKSGRERCWSDRTTQMWGYQGADAQFLLWWLTVGTDERKSGVGRRSKNGRYGSQSTSAARKQYFGGTHNVGKINPGKINPKIVEILEKITNGQIIPDIDKLWEEIGNKK